jgi:2-polyprenyl-6-methoxyphenol hydroxylase-like FAD-dependent oxidoreductase
MGVGGRIHEAMDLVRSGGVPGRAPSPFAAAFYRGTREIFQFPSYGGAPLDPRTRHRGGWLPQTEIEKILADYFAALGGEIMWETELTGLRQVNGCVVCEMKDGSEARCSWLVGCDGGRSTVRRALGIALVGPDTGRDMLLGDVSLDFDDVPPGARWPAGPVLVWLTKDGVISSATHRLDEQWRVMGTVSRAAGAETVTTTTIDLLQRTMNERLGDGAPRITDASWLSSWAVSARLANAYRSGRVFIGGDAAHVHSPVGGQGMNLGIADAFNLGWKLSLVCNGEASDGLLDTYEVERRAAAADALGWVARNTRLLVGKTMFHRLMRDYVVAPAHRSARVRRATLLRASQIRLNYRQSRLSTSYGRFPRHALQAGDRLPDARCTIDGRSAHLLDIMQGIGWQLLALTGRGPGIAGSGTVDGAMRRLADELGSSGSVHLVDARAGHKNGWDGSVLLDEDHDVHAALGTDRPALYLIRPDGYVGLRCALPAAEGTIRNYFAVALGTGRGVAAHEHRN